MENRPPVSGLAESLPASGLAESLPASGLAESLPASGLYVLLLKLKARATIRVGALGTWDFPAGWYLYTGSARQGLSKRVQRHFASSKPLCWHIDHLTTVGGIEPLGALLVPVSAGLTGGLFECELNRRVGELVKSSAPAPRFGASDCRAGCPAHLWHSARAVTGLWLAGEFPGAAYIQA